MNPLRSFARAALVVGAALSFFQAQSSANAATIAWTLSTNIALSDGGTLNGYFGINDYGYTNGTPFDLQTAGGTTNYFQHYTSTINAGNPNTVTVDFFAPDPAYSSSLTLVFQFSLLTAIANNPIIGGAPGPSFECEGYSCTANNTRYVVSGYASADGLSETGITPLPAALPLFAGGAGLIGLLGLRNNRRRKIARAAV